MNIKPMPHGLTGEHLGISHTLKHSHRHWSALEVVHLEGYMRALGGRALEAQEPPQLPWLPLSPERFVAHLGAGVVAFVVWWQQQWELRSAYRTLRYRFTGLPLPTDPYSRKNRARAAEARAVKRLVSRLRAEVLGDDDE